MRYELYSLQCKDCGARNDPASKRCVGCAGPLAHFRRCSRCQEENPPNAYVCLKCYTVLRQKPPVGIFHWHIPWTVSVVVIAAVLGWTALTVAKGWFAYAEAQIETNAALARQLEMQQREYEMRQHE